jgi:hypothetical protein
MGDPLGKMIGIISTSWRSARGRYLMGVILVTVVARMVYFFHFGVRFASEVPNYGPQTIDPALLKSGLLESVVYFKEMPPLYNLYLGLVLNVFPNHSEAVFQSTFLGCGVLLAVSMFLLMTRMQVPLPLSAAAASFFAVYPTTILYENYLYPTYPTAALLCLSALFLHRYLSGRKLCDGFVFFGLLAFIVLFRGYFHLFWFIATGAALFLAARGRRRQVVLVSLLPLGVVLSFYVKNYVMWGSFNTGRWTLAYNLHYMCVKSLDAEERDRLVREGKLSPVSKSNFNLDELVAQRREELREKKTGIPVLDEEKKSSGYMNGGWSGWDAISELWLKDATYVLRHHPRVYVRYVWGSVKGWYFQPGADFFIVEWDQERILKVNYRNVERLLRVSHLQTTWFNRIILTMCGLFAVLSGGRWLINRFRRRHVELEASCDTATGFTGLFCLFNIFYVSVITLAFSMCDHCRYRFEVMPFFYLFFAMLVWWLWKRVSPSVWVRAEWQARTWGTIGVILGLAAGLDLGTAYYGFQRYYNPWSDDVGGYGAQKPIGKWYKYQEKEDKFAALALANALRDPDTEVRWKSAATLGTLGPQAGSAVPALVESLQDRDEVVRRAAAMALGQIGSETAIPALAAALADTDHGVRKMAASALIRLGPKARDAVPALIVALGDRDTGVRQAAAAALGTIGPGAKAAIPSLGELLKAPDPATRELVAEVLKKITQGGSNKQGDH